MSPYYSTTRSKQNLRSIYFYVKIKIVAKRLLAIVLQGG